MHGPAHWRWRHEYLFRRLTECASSHICVKDVEGRTQHLVARRNFYVYIAWLFTLERREYSPSLEVILLVHTQFTCDTDYRTIVFLQPHYYSNNASQCFITDFTFLRDTSYSYVFDFCDWSGNKRMSSALGLSFLLRRQSVILIGQN